MGDHKHSRFQVLAASQLSLQERDRRIRVLIGPRLRVSGKEHRYRIPDVCVMALPYRSEPVLTTPPHLAIEILSPDDETADILAKVADYLRFGIPHIWIVNPHKARYRKPTGKASAIARTSPSKRSLLAVWISESSSPGWMSLPNNFGGRAPVKWITVIDEVSP